MDVKVQKISSRNHVFTWPMAEWDLNLHVIIGARYNYVIDTGLGAGSMAPVLALLAGHPRPTVVINTHYHWDHVWGNHCFGGAPVIAHRLCRQRVVEQWDAMLAQNGHYVRGEVAFCPPGLVFEDGLYFPDDGIRLFHTPGHTADSISVYDERDQVLDAGDNIGDTMDELVPSIETEHAVYIETLRRYQALPVAACVSGHNRVLGPEVFEQILNDPALRPPE